MAGRSTNPSSRRVRAARLLHRELQYLRGCPGPSSGATAPSQTGHLWALFDFPFAPLDTATNNTLPRQADGVWDMDGDRLSHDGHPALGVHRGPSAHPVGLSGVWELATRTTRHRSRARFEYRWRLHFAPQLHFGRAMDPAWVARATRTANRLMVPVSLNEAVTCGQSHALCRSEAPPTAIIIDGARDALIRAGLNPSALLTMPLRAVHTS